MARTREGNGTLKCSFCGKSQNDVRKLIAGPTVYICDECIDRKSTRLNSSHIQKSRMPSSA